MKILLLFIILFTCAFLLTLNGYAATLFQEVGVSSSPTPVGSGARALGEGGAFVAVADDATAASWNPAGLIQLEKPEFSIVGAFSFKEEQYNSDLRPEIKTSSETKGSDLNYVSATLPVTLLKRNLVFSVSYQRLLEFSRKFEYEFHSGDRNLDLKTKTDFSQVGATGAFGLAGAIQITPRLSLGSTLNYWTGKGFWGNGWVEEWKEIRTGTLEGNPFTITSTIRDSYSNFRGMNANFGFLWDINTFLTFGGILKTPFKAKVDHDFKFFSESRFSASVNQSISNELLQSETVEILVPGSFGFGLSFRVSDAFSFAVDWLTTDWSSYILTNEQGESFSPVSGKIEEDSSVRDTFQIHLGGEYVTRPRGMHISLRCGLFYDPEPSENSVKDFWGGSLGLGFSTVHYSADIAYQYRQGTNLDTGNIIGTSEADMFQHRLLASVVLYR